MLENLMEMAKPYIQKEIDSPDFPKKIERAVKGILQKEESQRKFKVFIRLATDASGDFVFLFYEKTTAGITAYKLESIDKTIRQLVASPEMRENVPAFARMFLPKDLSELLPPNFEQQAQAHLAAIFGQRGSLSAAYSKEKGIRYFFKDANENEFINLTTAEVWANIRKSLPL